MENKIFLKYNDFYQVETSGLYQRFPPLWHLVCGGILGQLHLERINKSIVLSFIQFYIRVMQQKTNKTKNVYASVPWVGKCWETPAHTTNGG